jgi:son of sevenless
MFEVITILETTSIYRLKAAWGALESSVLKKYAALKELFSSKCNFKNFRSEMKRHPIAPPCMPYLGLYQKDFIFLNQLPTKLLKTSSSSSHTQHSQQTLTPPTQQTQTQRGEGKVEREVVMINVTKMSSIASKLLELNSYQKIPYHFQENSQIVQIIKAKPRYRTEEEQYQRSLVLEPFAGGAAPTSGGNTSR